MSKLYSDMAEVYQAMYRSFINYNEEYSLYSDILSKADCNSLVEIGCGTGNLSALFNAGLFKYTGLDLSTEMLRIARQNNPGIFFVQGDMKNFRLAARVDAAIITGRTISYLLTDEELIACFRSIRENLNNTGIICFDFIDAELFIPSIDPLKKITHEAATDKQNYLRQSCWSVNKMQSGVFNWASVYYALAEDGLPVKIGEDNSMLRAFTTEEMKHFLQTTGYRVIELIKRPTYAFDTIVVVAEVSN